MPKCSGLAADTVVSQPDIGRWKMCTAVAFNFNSPVPEKGCWLQPDERSLWG